MFTLVFKPFRPLTTHPRVGVDHREIGVVVDHVDSGHHLAALPRLLIIEQTRWAGVCCRKNVMTMIRVNAASSRRSVIAWVVAAGKRTGVDAPVATTAAHVTWRDGSGRRNSICRCRGRSLASAAACRRRCRRLASTPAYQDQLAATAAIGLGHSARYHQS